MVHSSLYDRNLVALHEDNTTIMADLNYYPAGCAELVRGKEEVAIEGPGIEVLRVGRADPAILVEEDEPLAVCAQNVFDLIHHGLGMAYRNCRATFSGEGV